MCCAGERRSHGPTAQRSKPRILVAENDQQVLGFASIWTAENFLHNLFVHPDYWRTGVGTALLQRAMCVVSGPATLKCLTANTGALAFYARTGWRAIGDGVSPDGPYQIMSLDKHIDPARNLTAKPPGASPGVTLPCEPDS
jgi:GNAT superfamily N-acetyltransferase